MFPLLQVLVTKNFPYIFFPQYYWCIYASLVKIPAIGSRDSVHISCTLSKFAFQSAGVILKMR